MSELIIDQSRRCAYVDGQEIQLSPQEYRVLQRLGNSVDHVVSKAELLVAMWTTSNQPAESFALHTPAAVDLVIFRLRKKLANGSERPGYVETRRGFGYILHHARVVSSASQATLDTRLDSGDQATAAVTQASHTDHIDLWATLTRREWELFRLLGEEASIHLTNKALAQRLCMAEGTLKKHLQNLYRKLGVENRSGATLLAIRTTLALPTGNHS